MEEDGDGEEVEVEATAEDGVDDEEGVEDVADLEAVLARLNISNILMLFGLLADGAGSSADAGDLRFLVLDFGDLGVVNVLAGVWQVVGFTGDDTFDGLDGIATGPALDARSEIDSDAAGTDAIVGVGAEAGLTSGVATEDGLDSDLTSALSSAGSGEMSITIGSVAACGAAD